MADILIRHLKQKGSEHSALDMLVNQWGFDEKLIPKALQTVGSLFPHYSRHDESHSKQILINIERLLGDSIDLLTATDTWLLLEAAYWHDIGMVVPQDDIEAALLQPAFQQYIDNICNAPNHELHRFVMNFDPLDVSKCFKGADNPMDAVDKFRQLMAEWFRQQHAERSERIVQAPWNNAGISSPRTELIPARLFKLLGRICEIHGMPFSELLPNGLPFKEAGLAQEDCHPRFVACLLRMGDLLDLDDNRFCPVMERIAGRNRSNISKAHKDKHAGVYHLRIDRERIEISAECETIDGYLETFKWFDWLKQEIQDQIANWQDIVPNRSLGLLPTLGSITVRLKGELQVLKEGQRPQFSVDGAKAIELLQGNNLYSTKFTCVRELLQNSIDATLLRLWLIEEKNKLPEDWISPFSSGVKKILKSAQVIVELTEVPDLVGANTGKTDWVLKIIDQGTGISRSDLEYMLRIGGSQLNTQRQNKINTMPEWMKPSGAFGIGFQSVFLICEEVSLTTKSIFTNETLQVTMHNPTGKKEGLVLIKLLENDITRAHGTVIEIRMQLEKFAQSWSISLTDKTSIASKIIQSMDPVLDTSFPYEAAQLADQIKIFSVQSPLLIKARLITAEKSFDVVTDADLNTEPSDEWCFVKTKNGHEVAISYQLTGIGWHPHNSLNTWYRGQSFEYKGLRLAYACVKVNLMSGKAGAWLSANRENLASNVEEELDGTILSALEEKIRKDISGTDTTKLLNNNNSPEYSLFLEAMALNYREPWVALAKEVEGSWLDLNVPNKSEKFRDYFNRDSWILGEIPSHGEPLMVGCDLLVDQAWGGSLLLIILNQWLKGTGNTVQALEPLVPGDEQSEITTTPENIMTKHAKDAAKYRLRYQLKKEPQPSYSNAALATRLAGILRQAHGNLRVTLNFDDLSWSKLFLKKDTLVRATSLFPVFPRDANFVLLPYLYIGFTQGTENQIQCTPEQLDALSKWVLPNLVTPTTVADIRKCYDELVQYIDNEIMKPSSHHWEFWKNARGLR